MLQSRRRMLNACRAMRNCNRLYHVEVCSNPGPSGYQSLEVFVPPHVLTVIIDGVEVGEIPVAAILP
jgi:hypothetical protein